ncbi:DUF1479-domain-containing protein [Durotheca rogersii]|uniref:DUF1479-domain-containing protein n=1 Tax=Durotheca rogersii TaxID=419775 RepID=UPI00221F02E6|nr:DUF1479-domain-containing protein [Durotheca rogersii]KAI5863010.1 DUF1479-domain-containing protein [Durotheca rogersii]
MAVEFPHSTPSSSSSPTSTPLPLPPRFARVKASLIAGREAAITSSFSRLLAALREESDRVAASVSAGSQIIPEIDSLDIHNPAKAAAFATALRERGVAIIRGVVPPNVALAWRDETAEYLRHNEVSARDAVAAGTNDPHLLEVFWSPGQVKARADSRVLEAQRFLMRATWRCSPEDRDGDWGCTGEADIDVDDGEEDDILVSGDHPVSYADRIHIRRPEDIPAPTSNSSVGYPHIDGGSVERWEPDGYGRAGTYARIFEGAWEAYDPWNAAARLNATSDLYNGANSCSMFRMFQGLISLSSSSSPSSWSSTEAPFLRVCPMLRLATAYILLRPFFYFSPPSPLTHNFLDAANDGNGDDPLLHGGNWRLRDPPDSVIHGAVPGCGSQLVSDTLHPHLRLAHTLVPIPVVEPGDYVVWHPDLAYVAGAPTSGPHRGPGIASEALYVPACPLTLPNALYLARQRRAFLLGRPAPDHESYYSGASGSSHSRGSSSSGSSRISGGGSGGGLRGEQTYLGRAGVQDVSDAGGEEGLRSMGLSPWDGQGYHHDNDADEEEETDRGNACGKKNRKMDCDGAAAGDKKRRRRRRTGSRAERELLRQANGILFPDRFDTMYRRKGGKRT